ncbi:MAG TPA: HypC/HybG/HupF family hydrogenase formation chaperone [Gemmatales bacterium]|nr:HypC/HybG/HupF family hydrogenase formation chaperone [Gemmatales bacterium]
MCLGIPGEVTRWIDRDPLLARAEVRFGELHRVCHLACVPEAEVGDYVIVHAGIAISKVNPQEARRLFDEIDKFELQHELASDIPPPCNSS